MNDIHELPLFKHFVEVSKDNEGVIAMVKECAEKKNTYFRPLY